MEHFERAHVAKKDCSRKDNKSEENVKKQLKQMLQGYKQSDIKLIRDSENAFLDPHKQFNEDSSSVSGFSDLNLTNSSNDMDMTVDNISSNDEESNMSSLSKTIDDANITGADESSTSINSGDSISEKNIELLSEKVYFEMNECSQSDLSDNVSLISSLIETTSKLDSDDSLSFESTEKIGKIAKKLNKKESTTEKKKCKKRSSTSIDTENYVTKKDLKGNKVTIHVSSHDKIHDNNDDSTSPFVSVTATDMEVEQSFSQVFGNYKYSTVTNMPSNIQSVTHSTKSKSMFPSDNINLDDVTVIDCVDESNDVTNNEQVVGVEINFSDEEISDLPEEISNIYDNTLQSEVTFERESSTEIMEEFVSQYKLYKGYKCIIVVLKHPAELYVHGKISVQLLGGKMECLGHTFNSKQCEIYAPNNNYAQKLSTLEHDNVYYGLFSKLTASGLAVYEAEEIVTTIGQHDVVIQLSAINSCKIDYIENNFTVTDLFSKQSKNVEVNLKTASDMLGCSLYSSKPLKYFKEAISWSPAIEYALDHKSRGIVCGGKGTGKSTYLRYSVNKLLPKGPVLVIDLDPGQAEFTVAGNISATIVTDPLLGPNFTHLRRPERMLNIGMMRPMDNTTRYAAAVTELIAYCKNNKQFQNMPWIVNTMGMCNVMGLKFMLLVILHTQPTYIMQLDSKNAKKRFDCYLTASTVRKLYSENQYDRLFKNTQLFEDIEYNFFVADSIQDNSKNKYSLSARDERYLNYLAYFGEMLNFTKNSLIGITPYEVNYRDLYIGLNVRVNKDAVLKVINGKIVALCQLTQDNVPKVFTLADKALLCHGHALIRGIDYANELLYIITPSQRELTLTNTLVYADWVPELRGQEKQLPEGIAVPYRTASADQQRQLMFAPRRRFNPLQLIKMSRKS